MDEADIDGNIYAVLALQGKRIVFNAGLNKMHKVNASGHTSTLALFPARLVDAPPFLGLPPGTKISMDSVPTTVTLGPDSAIYVGELTGFPFLPGEARIYRIPHGHNPADPPPVYLVGFSHIIDIAFDEDGNLYVLEMAAETLLDVFSGANLSTGDLVRVGTDGSREILVSGLTTPSGIALDPDGGSIYISNCGVCVGSGEVLRLNLDDDDSSDD